jgi:hypothetical protein
LFETSKTWPPLNFDEGHQKPGRRRILTNLGNCQPPSSDYVCPKPARRKMKARPR